VTAEWYVRCDCGWEARAPKDELVRLIQQHASEALGLEVSKDQAQARPA
jgi:predicted small metal-binding protein